MIDPSADEPQPRPPLTPGTPLPRIHRTAPLTVEEAQQAERETSGRSRPKKNRKGKLPQGEPDADEKTKGALIEQTPTLDTVESRRAIRLAVGAGAIGVLLLVAFVLCRWSRPEAEPASGSEPSPPIATNPVPKERIESEARQLLEDARRFAEHRQDRLAEDRLHKVLSAYPHAAVAQEAQTALERRQRGLPYFPKGPEVAAEPP
ncbi:MAG: hypothetical protein IRY99_25285, partial [Isosphaeraceae bacterium]|nr:hypothetical protein [Isosphaeraceae bacterium]